MGSQLKNQRGQALAMLALMLFVMIGFTAITVDGARLAHTATELQTAVDSAATAAATALIQSTQRPPHNGDESAATAEAQSVATHNTIDGHDVSIGAGDITYKGSSVSVSSKASVNNFFAGIFQARRTRLEKTATARLAQVADATPDTRSPVGKVEGTIPLAIGACPDFFDDYQKHGDCEKLSVNLKNIGTGNDSGWTSFTDLPPADPSGLRQYLPQSCCATCGTVKPKPLSDGSADIPVSVINFVSGDAHDLVDAIESCLSTSANREDWTFKIPVVECTGGHLTSPAKVVGFATVMFTQPQTGNSLTIDLVCNASEPGRPRSGPNEVTNNFGTGFVALVE
jgi:Flp pilus assembly protein TadG